MHSVAVFSKLAIQEFNSSKIRCIENKRHWKKFAYLEWNRLETKEKAAESFCETFSFNFQKRIRIVSILVCSEIIDFGWDFSGWGFFFSKEGSSTFWGSLIYSKVKRKAKRDILVEKEFFQLFWESN